MKPHVSHCCAIVALAGWFETAHAEMPTLDRLSATRQRPLFVQSRKAPMDDAVRTPVKVQQPSPDLALNAIIFGPGVQIALLKRPGDAKPVIVRTGSDIDGWSVSTIAPRYVILTAPGRSITLDFPRRGNPPFPVGPTRRADASP
jgi:hypothetical protein